MYGARSGGRDPVASHRPDRHERHPLGPVIATPERVEVGRPQGRQRRGRTRRRRKKREHRLLQAPPHESPRSLERCSRLPLDRHPRGLQAAHRERRRADRPLEERDEGAEDARGARHHVHRVGRSRRELDSRADPACLGLEGFPCKLLEDPGRARRARLLVDRDREPQCDQSGSRVPASDDDGPRTIVEYIDRPQGCTPELVPEGDRRQRGERDNRHLHPPHLRKKRPRWGAFHHSSGRGGGRSISRRSRSRRRRSSSGSPACRSEGPRNGGAVQPPVRYPRPPLSCRRA